jgi:hypothetical protein
VCGLRRDARLGHRLGADVIEALHSFAIMVAATPLVILSHVELWMLTL